MKKSGTKIKVIRKKDQKVTSKDPRPKKDDGQNSARKIVTNVSTWVTDIQRRKRAETKEAIEKLFPAKPQTDSV